MQSILRILPFALVIMSGSITLAEYAPARLLYNDGSHDDVLMISYSAGTANYKISKQSLDVQRVRKPKLESVYLYEPPIFSDAMSLYRARNYTEAKLKFAECEVAFKAVDTLPDNYATLAGFYKMECSRRMFDLTALSSELEKYRKNGLTRENHLQQLEIYAFWEAVRLEDWERLDRLALSPAWRNRKLPASLRVQIEYCHALALDHLAQKDPGKVTDALNAYGRAMNANAATSIEIVLEAANRALLIYSNDKDVKIAMRRWKTEDEKPNSIGHQRLLEANALVKFYQQSGFDEIRPLEPASEKFTKYSASITQVASPAPTADDTKDDGVEPDVEPGEDVGTDSTTEEQTKTDNTEDAVPAEKSEE